MGLLRLFAGLLLLPSCWAAGAALVGLVSSSVGLGVSSISFLGGIAAFSLVWIFASHPVKTYVLGHELTHALWGLLFGARPSKLKVRSTGGSVNLTKSNLLITLAPYFFPFYTFLVLTAAAVTSFFVRPLPALPAWVFAIGFTWAFHVLFTVQSLGRRQPDVQIYGRIFSWTFIFLANVLLVMAGVAVATGFGFMPSVRLAHSSLVCAYSSVWRFAAPFF